MSSGNQQLLLGASNEASFTSATGGSFSTTTISGINFNVHTFITSGSDQTLTINSAGANSEIIGFVWGAAGGYGEAEGFSDAGGPGGFAFGRINVAGMSSLLIQVGAGAGQGATTRPSRAYPNGGLPSLRASYISGGGGGRSAIFNSSQSAGNALLIAGGGGGASGHGGGAPGSGSNMGGGGGGGTNGAGGMGYIEANVELNNGGGQSAGGFHSPTSSSGIIGRAPAQFTGGDAGDGQVWTDGINAAGGGGDGWYGGGVITDVHAGGGGGSGYFNTSFVTGGSLEVTAITSGKKSSVDPPQIGNTFYSAGIGVGSNNASGGNGRIVLIYRTSN